MFKPFRLQIAFPDLWLISVWLRPISDSHLQGRSYSVARNVAVLRVCEVIDRNKPLTQGEDTVSFSSHRGLCSFIFAAGDAVGFPVLHANLPDLQVPAEMSNCQ